MRDYGMTRPAPIIAGILAAILLLFGAYMGSYYAMLEGKYYTPKTVIAWPDGKQDSPWLPEYSIDGAASVLAPANRLDRLIRPGYWNVE